MSLRDAIFTACMELLDAKPVLLCCGHSLGGALATHFAFEFGSVFHDRIAGIQLTTFGSPRVGNFSYVKRFERIVPAAHRFVVGADPGTSPPPLVAGLAGR
jgi:predicted lipase